MVVVAEQQEEILRKRLAIAVKSIHWSYAIFWSISSTQPGVLKWSDGYYNGDIKTRKTVETVEPNADPLDLRRTEQLRDLYDSLADGETNPQSLRLSAALSPEDLTHTEWFFLVCMSFEFKIGQGLPGRAFANNKAIWLEDALYADSKVFCRSLLAKSASVQTVACFPYLEGVVELGTTDLVSQDLKIIHQVTSYLGVPSESVSKNPKYVSEAMRNENDADYVELDHDIIDPSATPEIECEEVNTYCTSNNSSEGFKPNHQVHTSFVAEGINVGDSQVKCSQFMDDDITNGVLNSVSSSDCISQTFASPEKLFPSLNEEKENDGCLPELENCKDMELISGDIQNDDIHYHTVVSTLLKSSNQLIVGPWVQSHMRGSSFVSWKSGKFLRSQKCIQGGASQKLLKKVVFEVAKMHSGSLLESWEDNERIKNLNKQETDETEANHVVAERRRRAKMHEKFVILGSLVPSTGKVDRVSLLDDTIEYLKRLENRVEELESHKEVKNIETRSRRRHQDVVERTSDNYGEKRIKKNKEQVMNKNKASDTEEMEGINQVQPEDSGTDDVTVSKIEKNVLIEVKCPWRENLLLEIMDATINLHLDAYSVQSSIIDGNLSLTIKSKVKESEMASVKTTRQAIQRVTRKC